MPCILTIVTENRRFRISPHLDRASITRKSPISPENQAIPRLQTLVIGVFPRALAVTPGMLYPGLEVRFSHCVLVTSRALLVQEKEGGLWSHVQPCGRHTEGFLCACIKMFPLPNLRVIKGRCFSGGPGANLSGHVQGQSGMTSTPGLKACNMSDHST